MQTSLGYHTFVKSKPLTQEAADKLFQDFKRYRDSTGKIEIIKQNVYKNDPFGRHYSIVYPNQEKGLSWKMRFSNRGFCTNGELTTCSIKAVINPKILSGERCYIVAANSSYLQIVEQVFNQEAEKISPYLSSFHTYSLNRIDYCINFDVSELKFDYPPELRRKLPEMIMKLIKHGDIPNKFSEEYNNEFQFYLKSKSVIINCYWKHDDLRRNFYDCPDLEKSFNIIRFEVQFRYPKTAATVAKIMKRQAILRSNTMDKLNKQAAFDPAENDFISLHTEYLKTARAKQVVIMEEMLSDERCSETIDHYFYEVIKQGDYYTFDVVLC